MKLASVILDIQTRGLSTPFTYVVCEDLEDLSGQVQNEELIEAQNQVWDPNLSWEYSEVSKTATQSKNKKKCSVLPLDYCALREQLLTQIDLHQVNSLQKTTTESLDLPAPKTTTEITKFPNHLNYQQEVEVGCMVLVPFGHQLKCGFVVDVFEVEVVDGKAVMKNSDAISQFFDATQPIKLDFSKLKPVIMAVSKPFFSSLSVKFAKFLSEQYVAPLSTCLRLFIPPGSDYKTRKGPDGWYLQKPRIKAVEEKFVKPGVNFESFKPRVNAVKQQKIMEVLKNGEIKTTELKIQLGNVSSTLKALEKAGAIEISEKRKHRNPNMPSEESTNYATDPNEFALTKGQEHALQKISEASKRAAGEVVLIDGVTGSGKTEVYLRAISEVIAQGKTACVLVPEISLTPQTVARFRHRFGDSVAVLHSAMSDGERFDQWDFINSGQAKVVVGARSALFAPLKNIGLIVIDEEHENSYKQDSAPRYVSRECAVWLARQHEACVVLGSATPSIEALYNCEKLPDWQRVVLPERTNNLEMPKISVVDMGFEFKSGSKQLFSSELRRAIKEELTAGHKVVLLHNRRGFANYLFCRECGFVPECMNCSTALTYHERLRVEDFTCGHSVYASGNMLACHHCGHVETPPQRCPKCGSVYIAKLGAGTQSVEDQLQALIDDLDGNAKHARVVRMDADTTKLKGGHQRLLEEFAQPGPAVLLGTQMIAKGLDFEDVTLVGVVLADTNLTLPDFRAAERTFDLILQVAGRAGRAKLPGRVIVQTYNPETPCIMAAARYDRARFLCDELPKRKMLGYPPYVKMANVLVWGSNLETVKITTEKLHTEILRVKEQYHNTEWEVLPPTPCVLSRVRGKHRYHVLVKSSLESKLATSLSQVLDSFKKPDSVNVAVDVSPYSLL